MWALLKKDYYINRFIFAALLLGIGAVIILLSIYSGEGSIVVGVMGTLLVPMLINKFSSTEEMRRNYDFIFNSFPVKRRDIVISKFLYYIIVYIVTAIVFGTLIVCFNKLEGFDINMVLLLEGFMFLYYSFIIAIPNFIYYFFSYEVSVKYSTIITLGIVYVPIILIGLVVRMYPELVNSIKSFVLDSPSGLGRTALLLTVAGVFVYLIFMILSIKGYSRRDLN